MFNPFKPKRIYLDHASTTPVLPEVKAKMEKYFTSDFYNPSAIYAEGVRAKKDLEDMRVKVARILGVSSKDIVFTASGTESDNLAILGIFEKAKEKIKTPHIIISALEHPGISEVAKEVMRRGGEVSIVEVNEEGQVDPAEVLKLIKENTVLVSIMLANNEIGVIEPIARIARLVREDKKKRESKFPFIHTDASQAPNYLSVNLSSLGVDLLTLDASKIYGPKGIGILAVRPDVLLSPIIFGGGQERGLRSGTESLALIAGFTNALILADKDKEEESARLNTLKNYFIEELKGISEKIIINTPKENSLPNIVSVSVDGMLAEFTAIKLDQMGILVSTGSACGNLKDQGGTQALSALGRPDLRESTLRFSLGRSTKKSDLDKTIKVFKKIMHS